MGASDRWCRFSLLDEHGSIVAGGAVSGGAAPDMETVNVIARLQLMAQRTGARLLLAEPCVELLELLELAGLPVEVER